MIYILEKKKIAWLKNADFSEIIKLLNREEKEYLSCKLNRKFQKDLFNCLVFSKILFFDF